MNRSETTTTEASQEIQPQTAGREGKGGRDRPAAAALVAAPLTAPRHGDGIFSSFSAEEEDDHSVPDTDKPGGEPGGSPP